MKIFNSHNWSRRTGGVAALLSLLAVLVPATASAALPDGRGWEMVSPVEKNGGGIVPMGVVAGGGVLQAAADGNAITYSSAGSFGEAQGAPVGSQYVSRRVGAGWSAENLTVALFAGSFGTAPEGVPYQLFSSDLSRGLLLSGHHCRSEEGACPVANPPLPGTGAPAGYQNYYLRRAGLGFEALLTSNELVGTDVGPANFELSFVGAAPDMQHILLSSCAALVAPATEVPLGEGCNPAKPNLYEWSQAGGLSLVNAAPGAALAAQAGAVSGDGSRIYFVAAGNLSLRQGAQIKQVDTAAGGGGKFETASADGEVAFFTTGAHLWRYVAATDTATDLTPGGGVIGVLGASSDGSYLYYLAADGVHLIHGAANTKIATAADASNYPPTTGTARVSADGTHLVFLSSASLTGYDNTDRKTGLPDSEVFLYDAAGAGQLTCVSCRPSGLQPAGSSTIPGSARNGEQLDATNSYKPRALSADGSRVFFDSDDAVIPSGDSDNAPDVYQWEAVGPNCAKADGCVSLISSGRLGGASFVDASTSGDDVFFITDASLVGADPGSFDLYDARVGGGFPEPLIPIPCFGDSCQSLPSETTDPSLTTQVTGPGNPPIHYLRHGHATHKRCKSAKQCKKHGKGKKHTKAKKPAKKGVRR